MLTGLAYLGLQSPQRAQWRELATDVLGAQAAESADEVLRLRVDDAAWRITVAPGSVDRLNHIGWNVESEGALHLAADAVRLAGFEVTAGTPAEARDRAVDKFVWFRDPWGFRHELALGQVLTPGSFRPGRPMSGFVTGDQGLGHVVLVVPDQAAAHDFYTQVLGFNLSDKIVIGDFQALFYHCNDRHHTLALAESKSFKGVHHLMLQVNSLDDVGSGFDACRDAAVPIRKGIGRHANDQMISFYLQTPSGLQIEYGTGGQTITEPWFPVTYHQNSTWGHRVIEGAPNAAGLPQLD